MTESERTCPHIAGRSDDFVDRLSSTEGLLVGFDFDGTLAPIAEDPDTPTIPERVQRSLERLAIHEHVQVAIVSGRQLSDLVDRVELDTVVYAGNHGLEQYRDGERTVASEVAQYEPAIQELCETLETKIADVPGSRIENKALTLTVHVRQTPPDRADDVRRAVLEAASHHPDLEVTTGKQVFEIRPSVALDKGTTMRQLEAETPDDWLTVYLGDDTTDEDGFEAVQPGGIGIHVGTDSTTAATYRIPDQQEVPAFVDWLSSVIIPEESFQ